MELRVHGHAGAPVLVFPTSMGSVHEWEDRGMMDALGERLARGWIQLWCVSSVDAESWYARWRRPEDRAEWHERYDRYLYHEVLPLVGHRNANPFLVTAGASFGAYHAMSFALRHPGRVRRVVGLSGIYDVRIQTDGWSDERTYFHNPADFVRNEHEAERLGALRSLEIVLAVGRDDPHRAHNEEFAAALHGKGIGAALRVWDGWAHDWPWWREMIVRYVDGPD
jgi:esterase/lipase superfamily enzyme